jgi:dTMP kinase
MRGRFITFEGGEGTGKSTQAVFLADRLKTYGLGVIMTREPGGSPGAEAIRHVLLSGAAQHLGSHAEAILFAAARDDHVRQLIRPALEAGRWVICDRFADSTRVYQGVLGNVDPRVIRSLERVAVGDTRPDITFILDVPAAVGLARAASRRGRTAVDRFEAETIEFHTKLREAYRELAEREPDRCVLIDAQTDAAIVADAIWAVVNGRLDPASAPVIIEAARP